MGLGSRPLKRLNISPDGQLPPNAKKVSRKLKLLNKKNVKYEILIVMKFKYYLFPKFLVDSSGALND